MRHDGLIQGGQDRTSGELGEMIEAIVWLVIYGGLIGAVALVVHIVRSIAGL